MSLKTKVWSLLLKLPSAIKSPILRRVVIFPSEISDTLRFKVAETEEELTQAFKLLHDAYVHEKLMEPHPSGLRVTKYHALPSTTTLIAIENNQVVGTVSLIRQSAFGLPLKSIFEIGDIPAGSRVAEVSALAIKKEHLHQRGRVLFPMLKFLLHYSHEHFGVTHFAIAVNPKWIDFYLSILAFKPLASKKVVENYSFVNGAPAVGAILNLDTLAETYFKIYGDKPKKRNLYHFFHKLEGKNMEFPLRKNCLISDPVLTPTLLEHFFVKKTNCLETMTEIEHSVLREMYDHPEYLKLIPEGNVFAFRKKRQAKRFEATLEARLQLANDRSSIINIADVSRFGLSGFVNPKAVDLTSTYKILLNIEEIEPCEVEGRFVRMAENGEFGFYITRSCMRWTDFVASLEARLQLAREKPVAQRMVAGEIPYRQIKYLK